MKINRLYVNVNMKEIINAFLTFNTKEGNKTKEFEEEFANYIGSKNAVSFASCRIAQYWALKALNFEHGSEVIMPAFNFWANSAMAELAGYKPVLVDIDLKTGNIDANKIKEKITDKTKIIFPTHLNGIRADIKQIMEIAVENDLRVIEDTARSCGLNYNKRKLGSYDIGTFSFSYAKNLYTFEGGMVTCNDKVFLSNLEYLKNDFKNIPAKVLFGKMFKGSMLHYFQPPFLFNIVKILYPSYDKVLESFKYKMSTTQAKQGLSCLKRLDETNKKREKISSTYVKELSDIGEIKIIKNEDSMPIYYLPIYTEKKEELMKFLSKNGIDTNPENAIYIPSMDRYKKYDGDYSNAKKLNNKLVLLPSHPNLKEDQVYDVIIKVREFYGR